MRILVVSQYFWPENFRINDLCTELVARGHKVTVVSGIPNYPSGDVFPIFQQKPGDFMEYMGVEIIRVPMIPRRRGGLRLMLNYVSFAVSASIIGPWKLRGREFDVVFAHQPSPVTVGLPALIMAKIMRVPMVMWILDLWPDTLHALGIIRSTWLLRLAGEFVSFIYRRCHLILVQSRSFIPQVAKLAPPGKRIEYSPSWAESIFQEGAKFPAPEVPQMDGVFNVMFAGNIGEAQDFPCILSAAEKLRQHSHIRWLIVGDGRMAGWVQQEIRRRGLEGRVLMLGCYPVERMPSFFLHANVLLVTLADQPIFAMTIPGKLQSYMAAGIPVVAALNGEGADVVRRANAGLTSPPGSADALVAAILTLSEMKSEERVAMGQCGLEYSRQEFDRDKVISQIERWLGEIVSNCSSR